jgi:hypothetical protein
MKTLFPILCYLAILSTALWRRSSTTEFVALGLGLTILLDRCAF